MNKIVRLIGIVICLIFCGNSEGMTLPQQFTLSKSIEGHQSELSQSKVFIAVTVHNQIPFISNLRKTLEANVTELARAGVQSHVLITCDGIQEDYEECKKQFKDFPLFTTGSLDIRFQKRNDKVVEIGQNLFNDYMRSSAEYFNFSPTEEELFKHNLESMVSISLTRWNQLNHINELMKEAKKSDLSPYLFMFDSDDIMHKDLLLMELLSLLETGADAASPGDYFGMNSDEKASSGNILRCTYENSSEILERASLDIDKYFVTKAPHFEEFAFNLFDGIVLEKVMEEGYKFGSDRFKKPIYPEMDFATLTPFMDALTNIVNVYLLDIPEEEKYQKTEITCGPMSAPFFSKGNKQNTLFYYMQHDDSLQGQMRKFDK
jgi:hypothetical protein